MLAGLVVLLALALYRAWPVTSAAPAQSSNRPASNGTPSTGTTTARPAETARGTASAGPAAAKAEAPEVRLTALDLPRPKPVAVQRNLFRFRARTRPVSDLPPGPGSPRTAPAPTGPAGPPGPPPITLKFIGVVERQEKAGRIAVLRDTVGHIFYGAEGEVIEGRYRIVRIGVESIELALLDGRSQTIRLTGS